MMVHEVTGHTPEFIRWEMPLSDAMQFQSVWWAFKYNKNLGLPLTRTIQYRGKSARSFFET